MSSKEEAIGRWQPVEDGFEYADGGDDSDEWSWTLYVSRGDIGINDPDNEDDGRWVKLPDDLRLCRFTPADWVDWEKVPPGYDWVAADGDGFSRTYTNEPRRYKTFWTTVDGSPSLVIDMELPLGIDWRQSLRRRPGSEEER